MKQPVWILNSSLLVLFFMSQLLLFMIQRAVPRRISISPGKIVVEQEQAVAPVDIKKIYEQDLFGTYEPPVVPVQSYIDETIAAIPKPPKIIIPEVPVEKIPTFFAPLDVVLKGVIFVKDDPASCIAIVQLKKTKEERNYQVGDLMEDAQILKILSNRIIIIRSNGQQETLYLREEDAVSDFNIEAKSAPKSIVESSTDGKYTVNVDEFTKRIRNLGEFINVLDLTTVYKQGKSFGCRIGKIDQDSLGAMLGFKVDDIIVKVDNYYVDDLANRIQLYDHIIDKHIGDVIEVILYRGADMLTLMYGLTDNVTKNIVFTPQQTHQKLLEELQKHESSKHSSATTDVVIQTISQDDTMLDASSNEDVLQSDELILNFDEDLRSNDAQKIAPSSNKTISGHIENMQNVTKGTNANNGSDNQRLKKEFEKTQLARNKQIAHDKNNAKRFSRKAICNAMQ